MPSYDPTEKEPRTLTKPDRLTSINNVHHQDLPSSRAAQIEFFLIPRQILPVYASKWNLQSILHSREAMKCQELVQLPIASVPLHCGTCTRWGCVDRKPESCEDLTWGVSMNPVILSCLTHASGLTIADWHQEWDLYNYEGESWPYVTSDEPAARETGLEIGAQQLWKIKRFF